MRIRTITYQSILVMLIISVMMSIIPPSIIKANNNDPELQQNKKEQQQNTKEKKKKNKSKEIADTFSVQEEEVQAYLNQGYTADELNVALSKQNQEAIPLTKALGKAKKIKINRSKDTSIIKEGDSYVQFGVTNSLSAAAEQPVSPVKDETLKNLDIKQDQAPYSVSASTGTSVSTINGSVSSSSTDFILPGRNGLSFALTRSYNSSNAQYYDVSRSYYNDRYGETVKFKATAKQYVLVFAPVFQMRHNRDYADCNGNVLYREFIGMNEWTLEKTSLSESEAQNLTDKVIRDKPTYTGSFSSCSNNQKKRDVFIYNINSAYNAIVDEQYQNVLSRGEFDSNLFTQHVEAVNKKAEIDRLAGSTTEYLKGDLVKDNGGYKYYRYYIDAGSTATIATVPIGNWYPYQTTSKTFSDMNFPIGKGWNWDLPYIINNKNINLGNGGQYEISGTKLKGYAWNDLSILSESGTVSVNQTSQSYTHVLSSIDGVKKYFNNSGQIIKITDKYNNFIDFGYENVPVYGQNLLTSISDPIGNKITIRYTTSEVVLALGDRTVTYKKASIQNNGTTIELLDRVTDPENRITRYEYKQATNTRYNLLSSDVNSGIYNGYALLEKIYHPTGAESQIKYENLPTTRYIGPNAINQEYRAQWTEDHIVITNPDTQAATFLTNNRINYSYPSDIASSYGEDAFFSTSMDDGLVQTVYQYEKDYIDEDNPTVYYNTSVNQKQNGLQTTYSNEFDRGRKMTTPIKTTTEYKNTQLGSIRTEATSQSFDDAGNLLSQTAKNGISIQYTYFPGTHLVQSILQPIDKTRKVFTQVSRTGLNDPETIEVRADNSNGALLSKKSYSYDSYGNVTNIKTNIDATKQTVQEFAYSEVYKGAFLTGQQASGRNSFDEPFTVKSAAEYNALTGQITKYTDGKDNIYSYSYDKIGRVKTVINPENRSSSVQYDDINNIVTQVNEVGAKTESRYDQLGRLEQQGVFSKEPGDKAATATYKAKVKKSYDAWGRVISDEDALGNKTSYEYVSLPSGVKQTITSPNNNKSIQEFNPIDLTTIAIDGLGNKVVTSQDIMGNPVTTTSTEVNSDSMAVMKTTDWSQTFDYLGNVLTLKDTKGNITEYSYDYLGRLSSVKNALKEETKYQYNWVGGLTSIQNPDGSLITKQYDDLGRLSVQLRPDMKLEKFKYDGNNNVVLHQDKNKNQLTYSYNFRNQVLTFNDGDSTDVFTYTRDGLRETMQDPTGLTTYDYDLYTRQLSKVTYPDLKTLSYSYDERGNAASLTGPFNDSASYGYDPENHLEKINNGVDAQYQYLANGALKQTTQGNGVVGVYQYEGLRLKSLSYSNPSLSAVNFSYDYDKNGNMTSMIKNESITHEDHNQYSYGYSFGYDNLNRIQTSSQNNEAYEYDSLGNRKILQSDQVQGLENSAYEYNKRNQLNKVTIYGKSPVTYRYNGDGLMVERTEDEKSIRYYYSGTDIIAEGKVNSDGTVSKIAAYVRGNGLSYRVDQDGSKAYYVTNGHGDVEYLLDSKGKILNSYKYDLWGKPVEKEEKVSNPFLYAGEYYDASTNLQYLRARWYDPSVGRFINEDTYEGKLTNPLSFNLYTYTANNPLLYIDPSGHEAKPGVWAGALIDIARQEGASSQYYWDIKNEMGISRKWGDVRLSRNQFMYLFNLATMTICSDNGGCRNATAADAKNGYTADLAAWAKRELMYAYDKEYVESYERIEDTVLGLVGATERVGNTVKGWIKRETFKEIRANLSKEAQKKFADSMKKGFVGEFGANGIKSLKSTGGIDGYMYEIKIKGKYGTWRVLGNYDEKTGHIIFDKLKDTH